MEENRKQQLAISSSKPSASSGIAPSFAGNDNCDGDETKAITPDQFMEGPQGGESTHGSPTILRLEELTSMDPTVEVGFEIADSVGVLKLTNPSNPEMERAGEKASRGARLLQEGAKLVTESQQILRSAIVNDYKSSFTKKNKKINKHESSSTLARKRTFDGTTTAAIMPFVTPYRHRRISYEASLEEADSQSDDSEALVNHGVYASFEFPRALLAVHGMQIQTSSIADDSETLVNYGVHASVKSQLASGKGTKTQTLSAAQAASQTQSTNQNGAS